MRVQGIKNPQSPADRPSGEALRADTHTAILTAVDPSSPPACARGGSGDTAESSLQHPTPLAALRALFFPLTPPGAPRLSPAQPHPALRNAAAAPRWAAMQRCPPDPHVPPHPSSPAHLQGESPRPATDAERRRGGGGGGLSARAVAAVTLPALEGSVPPASL